MTRLGQSVLLAAWLSSMLSGCRCSGPKPGPTGPQTSALQRLAIYYGSPSRVEGARSISEAAEKLSAYNVVVLGTTLQQPEPAYHTSLRLIVPQLSKQEVFGRIPLGTARGGRAGAKAAAEDLTAARIEEQLRAWQRMRVKGILFDQAGYDSGNTRERQNRAFAAAHQLGLLVCASALDPDDLFAAQRHERNPRGEPTVLRRGDCYLYEGFGLRLGKPEDEAARRARLQKLAAARQLGVRLFGVTTAAGPDDFDRAAWARVVEAARRAGLDGLGWGEPQFAALDNRLPWRW